MNIKKNLLFLLVFILLVNSVNSSSCLLNKINTKISVFEEYDSNVQKLEINAKLSYINMDSGETKPIPGQKLNIILNITKKSGENEEITREVNTNSGGWAKRTFYLEDVKSYDVKVIYDGSGAYKSAIGTLSGGGDYEQVSYVTNLPEGVSLTTCMPLLILFGFLGAAMYASGGNPFGFVDLTPSRGFRMNRNLRKSMFTQMGVWVIGSAIASALQSEIKQQSRSKEVSGKNEKGSKEEGGKSNENKTPSLPTSQHRKGNSEPPKNTPQNQGNVVNVQDEKVQKKENTFIRERGNTFHFFANLGLIVLSIFSGQEWIPPNKYGGTRDIANRSRDDIINRWKNKALKNTSLKVIEEKVKESREKAEKARDINNKNLNEIITIREELEKQAKNEKEKLDKLEPGDSSRSNIRANIRDLNKRIKNLKRDEKNIIEMCENNNKQIVKADETLKKIEDIRKDLIGKGFYVEEINNMTYNSLSAMYNEKKESFTKEEMKKFNKEIESIMETKILNDRDIQMLEDFELKEKRILEIDEEMEELVKTKDFKDLTEDEKNKLDTLSREKELLENNLYLFTQEQQYAEAILNNTEKEGLDITLAKIMELENKQKELNEISRETNKVNTIEQEQRLRDIIAIDVLVNDEEKRKEIEKIHSKILNKEKLTEKEIKDYEKYGEVMFDEERQRNALGNVSGTNLSSSYKPTTIEELIQMREEIKNDMENKIKNMEENLVFSKEDFKRVEKIKKEGEKMIELSTDLTYQKYEAKNKVELSKTGKYNSYDTVQMLDPNRDSFSDEYNKYKRLYEKEKEYLQKTEELGIIDEYYKYDKKYDHIKEEYYLSRTDKEIEKVKEELGGKIKTSIRERIEEFDKKPEKINEAAKQYVIAKEIDDNYKDEKVAREILNKYHEKEISKTEKTKTATDYFADKKEKKEMSETIRRIKKDI